MKYAIDTSVAVKWVISEIDSDKAIRLRDGYKNGIHEVIAPDLFPTEIANVLMMAERRGRIAAGDALPFMQTILKNVPTLHQATPLLPRAIELAQTFRQTVYDCLYAALAERESCDMVSADDRFVNAVQPTLPFVISLASML
jgi:predicted nucleic acid-binding protein